MNYSFSKKVNFNFDEAISKIEESLKTEGFGILTRIDADKKFKEKLNIDFYKYSILGACNPAFAHKAIMAEQEIGLFLPCNVIVYEKSNEIFISIIKPSVAMNMIDNPELKELAQEVENKLKRVIELV